MINLILACIAVSIFIIYNIVAIAFFGIPSSLSTTYYYYNEKKNHPNWIHKCGWVFTVMMFSIAILLMPAWLNITETISPWSQYLRILAFLGAGSIGFVGAAPAFRSCKMENSVHMIAAGSAAAFSIAWDMIVCWKLMWIVPLSILLIGGIAHLTKTAKKARDYWWEMAAFLATFATIITECILTI